MYSNNKNEKLIYNEKNKNMFDKASFLSRMFFFWLNPLISLGSKKILEDKDIFEIGENDQVKYYVRPIEKKFEEMKKKISKEKKHLNNLIIKIILKHHKIQIILYSILGIIKGVSNIFGAKILGFLIELFSTNEQRISFFIYYIITFIILKLLGIFLDSHLLFGWSNLGFRVKFSLNYIIFKKILKIKQLNNNKYSFGDLININNVETNKFISFFNYIPNIVSSPINLILGLYFLIDLTGWSSVIGLSTFIIFIFFNVIISKKFIKYEIELISKRGIRIKFVNEMISNLRFIKFNVLEEYFYKKLEKIKENELKSIKAQFQKIIYSILLAWIIPLTFITVFIITDYLIEKTFNLPKILQGIILFSVIDQTIKFIPNILVFFNNALISGRKINEFLFQEEINFKNINYINNEDEENNVVKIENLNFFWKKKDDKKEDEKEFELKNIDLKIKKNSLVAIIGKIGSGKTSLINSLFGELDLKEDEDKKINLLNSISIVNQKPWIRNKTIKENILNGKEYDSELYNECLKNSCLIEDLNQLDSSDETLIGDKGINLSGGQKVRISIARALYSEKNMIIMDDPLSALDTNVTEYIFKNAIQNFLKNKTRIIITHNINYLRYFDRILLLDNGKIVEDDSFEKIQNTENYKNLINSISNNDNKNNKSNEDKIDNLNQKVNENKDDNKLDLKIITEKNNDNYDPMITRLMNTENKSKGTMNFKFIINYLKFSENNYQIISVWIVMILLIAGNIYSNLFLKEAYKLSQSNFLLIYTSINIVRIILIFIKLKLLYSISIKISRKINKLMVFKILHCSLLKFLDKIPIGTILNRFSLDTQQVDKTLVMIFSFVLFLISGIVASVIICCIFATPIVLIFFIILIIISHYYRIYYMKTFREITRLLKISSSPLNQIINETILGSYIIRAFNSENKIINEHNQCMNNNLKYLVIQNGLKSWFVLRISILNLIVIIPCFIFSLVFKSYFDNKLIGIMFNYLLVFVNLSIGLLNIINTFEETMISFERCLYLGKINSEKKYAIDGKKLITNTNKNKMVNIKNGNIILENLKLRYSKNLPYIIKGINCELKNKVGIVGRTGSGKSTLIQSFYGLFDDYEGNIIIDDINIKNIDLQNLRSLFSIISQDPILFEDTVRNNLDPLKLNSEQLINEIIIELKLEDKIKQLGGLNGQIESGGKNLSNGEKQLFCLIRIILNKKKIILLDEATSYIDNKTEEIIQKTMDKYFQECTQIIIAHRLNTIINCDKILVLDDGKILEYDSPKNLLKSENSYFYKLINSNKE